MSALGFLLATASAVCNGSFAAISKSYPNDPLIFNLHFCVGILLSSMVVPVFFTYSGNEFGVPPVGLVAGLLLVLSTTCAFLAVPRCGLAIGQGVWGGVAVIVSFLWGAVGPSEISGPLRSTPMSMLALFFLLCGIYGILLSDRFKINKEGIQKAPLDARTKLLSDDDTSRSGKNDLQRKEFIFGIGYAVLVGIFGGSILVPLSFVESKYDGIGFLPSFGVGSIVSGATITSIYIFANKNTTPAWMQIFKTSPPGIAAGIVFNIGNICSIIAMGSGGLSYGVAQPIMQCALFISGLWGIFYFKEVHGMIAISGFFLSGAVLIGGAVILGVYGPEGK